jgi:hypothetical protein
MPRESVIRNCRDSDTLNSFNGYVTQRFAQPGGHRRWTMAHQRQPKVGARSRLGATPSLDLGTAETETLRWLRTIGFRLPVNREWDGDWHAA